MRIRERFNPRAPCGARHLMEVYLHQSKKFQPTRPLRGATNSPTWDSRVAIVISTHAPLAGRDAPPLFRHNNIETISTHAPLAGRDQS